MLALGAIYSGILWALLGTALATNLYYPSYKAHTKMLIPFVL
jgi:hypothetical protein